MISYWAGSAPTPIGSIWAMDWTVSPIVTRNSVGEESRVIFGPGITASSVILTTNVGQVVVCPGTAFEGVTIGTNGNDVLGPRAVDRFEFADGTSITYTELVARGFDIEGTAEDDQLDRRCLVGTV